MLLMNLIPPEKVPTKVTFNVQGTTERQRGPFDFAGVVEITLDFSALGDLALKAMQNRGHHAKKGPVTVRFHGAAGYRVRPKAPPTGTCDWGSCDAPVVDWRWSTDHGWLPVCEAHRTTKEE